jgi:Family of unknown function (DUF6092)
VTASVTENPLFAVALYLVASARDCVDEPLIYGPFRIVEGVSRLVEAAATIPGLPEDEFLLELRQSIDEHKYAIMTDREGFVDWLGDLLARCAAEAKRRNLGD